MNAFIYMTTEKTSGTDSGVSAGAEAGAPEEEWVCVPRRPTKAMLDAAWAYALDEDAEGVWRSMIEVGGSI